MHQLFQTWRRTLIGCGLLSLLVLATGCSGSGTITGKVSYRGRPLTGGTVVFASTEGQGSKTAQIQPDGTYTITRMRTGPVQIAVDTRSARPPDTMNPRVSNKPPKNMQPPPGTTLPPDAPAGYGDQPKYGNAERLPPQYADPANSGLTYTVTAGAQTYDISLK
jgi:hypothetical protein